VGVIYSTPTTERLTRRLSKAGKPYWVAASTADACGKYLLFIVGGRCVGSCGWNVSDAEEKVRLIIHGGNDDD
jgi:hypothetical protein